MLTIYLQIVFSLIITLLILRRKKISFENILWILLPIDMYGVEIGGMVLKPYYFFCILLFLRIIDKGNRKLFIGDNGQELIGFFLILSVAVNTFNGGNISSFLSAAMMLFVYFCACIYATNLQSDFNGIHDSLVASSIGYGIVFIINYYLTEWGFEQFICADRFSAGTIMQFSTMNDGSYISLLRLRGFFIDPNACCVMFISIIPFNFFFYNGKMKDNFLHIVSIAICIICVFLTKSRAGLIAAGMCVALSVFYSSSFRRNAFKFRNLFLFSLFSAVLLFYYKDSLGEIGMLFENEVDDYFNSRSQLNSDFGRASIWKESIEIWIEKGFFGGIGYTQMMNYSTTGRVSHSTWIEFLSGNGFILGGAIIVYFLLILISSISCRKHVVSDIRPTLDSLIVAEIGIIFILSSIDNGTISYLWFLTLVLIKIINTQKKRSDNILREKPDTDRSLTDCEKDRIFNN